MINAKAAFADHVHDPARRPRNTGLPFSQAADIIPQCSTTDASVTLDFQLVPKHQNDPSRCADDVLDPAQSNCKCVGFLEGHVNKPSMYLSIVTCILAININRGIVVTLHVSHPKSNHTTTKSIAQFRNSPIFAIIRIKHGTRTTSLFFNGSRTASSISGTRLLMNA